VLSFDTQQSFKIDQGVQFNQVYGVNDRGQLDSTALRPSRRTTTARFDTPLKIFDFKLAEQLLVQRGGAGLPGDARRVRRHHRLDVQGDARLPADLQLEPELDDGVLAAALLPGSWNVSPDGEPVERGLALRAARAHRAVGRPLGDAAPAPELRRERRARRSTRSPPASGPVERFRHSINPVLSYSYSPTANVSDEFLRAIGARKQGYWARSCRTA
jgi:hypothetical protein